MAEARVPTGSAVPCRASRRAGEGIEQESGELRPDAGLLMLEVHDHIGARSRAAADGLRPAPEVLGRVALVAQTKIAVARRDLDGGREFLAVGDAEREIPRPEPLEHLGVHPGRVPELERGAGVRGRMPRNASSTARSLRKYGGSWKRIAPSLGPSVAAVRRKYCRRSAQSRSFAICVMRLGALRVSLNLSGVSRFQPARIFSFGVR